MKKLLIAAAILLASTGIASAQGPIIDVFTNLGPSGTRMQLELPISSYQYHSTTTCSYSYRHRFRVYKGSTLKIDETFDVINPYGTTEFYRTVDFTGWNLAVGNVVTFYSYVIIISGPYINQFDKDYLYGDVVDLIGRSPSSPREEAGSFLAAAIVDDKNRLEALFA